MPGKHLPPLRIVHVDAHWAASRSKFSDEVNKISGHLLGPCADAVEILDNDSIWNFDGVDLAPFNAVPQRVGIAAMPRRRAYSLKERFIDIVLSLPAFAI